MTELLTIGEAAKLLKVHPNTLRNWDKQGILKPARIGTKKLRRYKREDILKLLDNDNNA
ncbi:helix-turn-helix domain-containing protein [Candidatus Saccharibacteria bacterium]|nr:helix-turn-helix domain-containing protein [Candidatus Saccharibacteria bacterium]